jgi:branched-chain amino acid transport system permease protein
VRAASTDPRVASIQGINVDRLSLIVVGLGTALAGLSGVVAGPLLTLSPTMGSYILIDSFIVVVIGGLGSFTGAFVAALLIGQIHNFGAIYLPWAATILPFLLMVAILIWRPTGLAGSRA